MSIKAADLWLEIKATLKLGGPIMVAQLLMLSMVFVDNIMVGPLGANALASLALATGMYSLINIVLIGMLSAISPMIVHRIGTGGNQGVGQIVRQGWLFASLLTTISVAILWNAAPILLVLDQKIELIPDAAIYLKIMCLTAPAQMLVYCSRHLTEAVGDSMVGAVIIGIAALFNIPLDFILINGMSIGGISVPAFGVAGAAMATAFLSWLSFLALLGYIYLNPRYRVFEIWKKTWQVEWPAIREMLRIGLPLGGAIGAEMAFFVSSTFVMGTIATEVLAAHQIALNAASLTFMIPLGLSFAVAIRVGHYSAAENYSAMRNAWQAGIIITFATQTLAAAAFIILPEFIVGLYSQAEQVELLAVKLLGIAAFFQLVDGLQVVGMGALRGMKDAAYAFKATMISFWIFGAGSVSIAYFIFDRSPTGIWIGLLVGLATAALCHHCRMFFRTSH